VAQFVEEGGAKLAADFLVSRADRLNVLLVKDDSVRQIQLEGALLGERDTVKESQQQVIALGVAIGEAGFARRPVLDDDGDVGQFAAKARRQPRQGLFHELFEAFAIHVARSVPAAAGPPASVCYNNKVQRRHRSEL